MLLFRQSLSPALADITGSLASQTVRGTQVTEEPDPAQSADDAVGRPFPHLASRQQTTGEAEYLDDIPTYDST